MAVRNVFQCLRPGLRRGLRRGGVLVVALVSMLALSATPGFVDMAQVGAMRDQAARLSEQLGESITQREQELARLDEAGTPPTDPRRQPLEADLSVSRASKSAVDGALREVDQVLWEAKNPTDPISAGLGAVAPFLPEPSRTPLILGGALLVTLLRARQMKTALVSVARGLDKAMRADEQFRQRFTEHAPLFRSVQTPAARRVVDEATHDGFMVRLPI